MSTGSMGRTVHLVVGPDEHGVVRHGMEIAAACGDRVVRTLAELPGDTTVVHVPFTDRLFGTSAESALDAFVALADGVAAVGAELSVTLHDVPHDQSPLQRRRRAVYEQVIGLARGVVVNSHTELGLVQDACDGVHSLRAIALPVYPAVLPEVPLAPGRVAVLGFVFPDRGYEDVLAALPAGATLTAIGRAAAGHEHLPDHYAEQAGGRWHCTGFVPDADLAAQLAVTAVPIAPNRRVTASASINTWIGHGRRPLVPDSPYAREIEARRPGSITVYEPDRLADAIEAALADPASTWLTPDVLREPALTEVAVTYRRHLAACAPPRADGGLVPGNRWDLLDTTSPAPSGSVSVVVPYFENQHGLDLVLTMLARQTRRPLEIVVVDDGSSKQPDVSCAGGVPVIVLRQDDLGFRAARARNVGAAAATGDVLVFVDGDTVPEPGFVEALTRLPLLCPDAVTVGRRRHADLAAVTPREITDLDRTEWPEPAWLRDAYRASADLLHADRRSYRHVISAVLALPRALFDAVGGFDERFVGYGGEDWELAHRLRTAGAVFAHVPAAVAWHDGPDWAFRADAATRARTKNAETAALAVLLPDPDARGGGRGLPYPSVAVSVVATDAVDALALVRSSGSADCAFWFDDLTGGHRDLVLLDPAVHVGAPPNDVLARAWCHVRVHVVTKLDDLMALADRAERHGRVDTPALTLRAARAVHRVARWPDADADRLFGRHDRASPVPAPVHDLAARLRE